MLKINVGDIPNTFLTPLQSKVSRCFRRFFVAQRLFKSASKS